MKYLAVSLLISSMLLVGCLGGVTGGATGDFRIADQNVLGATYIVCGTKVRWNGAQFSFEGLEGNVRTRTFSLGKLEYKPTQVRQLDNLALAIDNMFNQMCQSTISLREDKKALAQYIERRDKTALELFGVIERMEQINRKERDPDAAISQQRELLEAAKTAKQ